MPPQSRQGHFDQCRYAAMLSHTGKLQVVVFSAAFESGDHPLSEEGKYECQPHLSETCSYLSLSSSTSQEVVLQYVQSI